MDENNNGQGYPDNFNSGTDEGFSQARETNPGMGGFTQPSGYADPNMSGFAQPSGYADPNMSGFTQPSGYADPNMNLNGFGDPVPYQTQIPKKKKGGKIALISAICVLAAAAVCVGAYFIFRKTPEEAVKSAIQNTFTDSVNQSTFEEAVGFSEFEEDKQDFEADLTVESIHELDGMAGSSITIDGAIEKQDDGSYNMSLKNAATIGGETLTANLTCLDKVFYIEVPELYDDAFRLDLASMMETVDSSELDTETQNEVKELYEKYMTPATEELKKSVTYAKIGRTKIEDHNGASVGCKQYTVTLTTAAVRDYVEALSNYLNAYASDYITDDQLENAGVSRTELMQVFQYLPTYYGMLFSKDFVVDVYVKDGNVVRVGMDYKLTALSTTVSMTLDLMGEDDPADDIYFEANAVSSDDETLGTVTYTNKTERNEDAVKREIKGSIVANGETTGSLEKTESYVSDSQTFTSYMTISDASGAWIAYDLEAALEDVEKGKSFAAKLNHLRITDGGDTVYAEFTGSMKFGNLGKEITTPTANTVDSSDMTDTYMSENINQEALARISEAWKKAAGAETSDDQQTSDDDAYEIDLSNDDEQEIVIDSSDWDDVDYSGIVIKSDNHTVAVMDPSGYERSYASESEIDIYNDTCNAYYTLSENCDKDATCSGFTDYFEYMDDSASVISQDMEQVTNSDGLTMDCYVINSEIYGVKVRDYYYFYPLNETDYIIVDVNIWASEEDEEIEADMTEVANELAVSSVISVQ